MYHLKWQNLIIRLISGAVDDLLVILFSFDRCSPHEELWYDHTRKKNKVKKKAYYISVLFIITLRKKKIYMATRISWILNLISVFKSLFVTMYVIALRKKRKYDISLIFMNFILVSIFLIHCLTHKVVRVSLHLSMSILKEESN